MTLICVKSLCCHQIVASWLLWTRLCLKEKKERCLIEVHSFVEIFHTRSYKLLCSMCLTAKKRSILDLWAGFFQPKRKMAVPCVWYIQPWNCLLPSHTSSRSWPRRSRGWWYFRVRQVCVCPGSCSQLGAADCITQWALRPCRLPCTLPIAGSF